MIKLTVLDRDDTEQEIEIPTDINLNLMEVLKASDYHVLATCGGMALCATCHVQILEGLEQLAEAQDAELDMLDTLPDAGTDSRLACQLKVNEQLNGIKIKIKGDEA
jgi:2Fe-2S ferredoxin